MIASMGAPAASCYPLPPCSLRRLDLSSEFGRTEIDDPTRQRSRSAGRTHRVLTAADSSQRPDQPHLPHRVGELRSPRRLEIGQQVELAAAGSRASVRSCSTSSPEGCSRSFR